MADELPPLLPGFEENIKKLAAELPDKIDSVKAGVELSGWSDWVVLCEGLAEGSYTAESVGPMFLPKGSPVDPKDLAYARERLGKYVVTGTDDPAVLDRLVAALDFGELEQRVLTVPGVLNPFEVASYLLGTHRHESVKLRIEPEYMPLEMNPAEIAKRLERNIAPKAPVEDGAKKRKEHPWRYTRDRNKRHRRV